MPRPLSAKRDRPATEITGQASFDIANLSLERTGLPFVVLISQKGRARHGVRIKLGRAAKVRPSEMFTVVMRPAPRLIRGRMSAQEFDAVRRWIELNGKVLIEYWNGDIEYTEDALAVIREIGQQN